MTTVPQLQAPEFAPGDLDGLCAFVWKRIAYELHFLNDDRPSVYPPLAERLRMTRAGFTETGIPQPADRRPALLAGFEANLRQLAVAPVERLRMIVMNRATSLSGRSAHDDFTSGRLAEVLARNASEMPRINPAELVRGFASRGITIQPVGENLHASPAALVTKEDREVLRNHKPAILAALAQPEII